jgi:lipoate---protein ligase
MADRPAAIRRVVAGEELAWTARVLDEGVAAPLLRVWLYEAPALVLGRGQGAEAAGAEGLPVHVRPTGGGAVLVGPWMIGVSVVLPVAHALVKTNIAASYRWIGAAHARWLRGLGVDAEALQGERTQSHWACFAGRGPWEVEVGGRKIVGLAQARRRAAVLLSAGCLIEEPPWDLLCAAMQRPAEDAAALASTTVSAGALLRRPVDAARWARSLLDALAQQLAAPQGALGVPAFAAGAFAAGAAR